MFTWTGRTGHAKLRSFTDAAGNFWLEQNTAKRSKWARFAREGHDVAREFAPAGGYSGRTLIGGSIYTPSEAVNKFLKAPERRLSGELLLEGPSPITCPTAEERASVREDLELRSRPR